MKYAKKNIHLKFLKYKNKKFEGIVIVMNNVNLIGRLTRDSELRYTPSGIAVARFTLAVQRDFYNNENVREVDYINCIAWRKTAENLANYTMKGSLVGVTGRIQTRNYENSEGKKVYVTEIVAESVQFLASPNRNNQTNNNQNQNPYDDPFTNYGEPIDINDEDLPF